MIIGSGKSTYEWIDGWAKIPDSESVRTTHVHDGIVFSDSGHVLHFLRADGSVVVLDKDGNLVRSWDSTLTGAHGMTLVREDGSEYLWLADENRDAPAVIKTTLDGDTVMSLQRPELPVYRDGVYRPTSVAVNEERHGGNGDVWVSDGYGESHIHRYDKGGNYVSSINGEEGEAGRFAGPHGIWVDTRKSEPELYVADRTNQRVQVYDLEGKFKRAFGSDYMDSPSGFLTDGDLLVIIEHRGARLTVLDPDDTLVCYVGENAGISKAEGWPNNPREQHQPGRFNSPHSMAIDGSGNLYIAEWLKGGRITKLVKK